MVLGSLWHDTFVCPLNAKNAEGKTLSKPPLLGPHLVGRQILDLLASDEIFGCWCICGQFFGLVIMKFLYSASNADFFN